ncbi:MAG TPA: hypothetical protein VGQ99_05335 [Tepidisphaeraceae bacterium]|nr:hypothetical protein [Tepidisphaeraceae bacterium]
METEEQVLRRSFTTALTRSDKMRIVMEVTTIRRRKEHNNQLVGMVGQQIQILETHVHHIKVAEQGQGNIATDELRESMAKAKKVVGEVERQMSVGPIIVGDGSGSSPEEQSMMDELERDHGPATDS